MAYRTKTYIAADWDGDKNAIDKLREWNDGEKWSLSFTDAHDLTQARDDSLNCSIKASLVTRMDASKTFVLIVGSNTKSRRAGECTYCSIFDNGKCKTGHTVSNDSFIEYECKRRFEIAKISNLLSCIVRQLLIKASALMPSKRMVRTLLCKK